MQRNKTYHRDKHDKNLICLLKTPEYPYARWAKIPFTQWKNFLEKEKNNLICVWKTKPELLYNQLQTILSNSGRQKTFLAIFSKPKTPTQVAEIKTEDRSQVKSLANQLIPSHKFRWSLSMSQLALLLGSMKKILKPPHPNRKTPPSSPKNQTPQKEQTTGIFPKEKDPTPTDTTIPKHLPG